MCNGAIRWFPIPVIVAMQMSAEERALMSCLEPCPLAIRILSSAFMRKAVSMEEVRSLSNGSVDRAINTLRCAEMTGVRPGLLLLGPQML